MKEEVHRLLEASGFTVVDYSDIKASVDFVAIRGDKKLVVRVLGNLDALRQEHARDMLALAHMVDGIAIVVANYSRWGPLREGVLYYRYGVPAMSLGTFRAFLEGELPTALFVKGKEIVQIDREKLRKRRKELGLSMQGLAELVGTTKETIYRYEHGQFATREMAERLEKVLGERLRKGVMPRAVQEVEEELDYPTSLLRALGAEVSSFRKMPWQAMGRDRLVISFLWGSRTRRKIKGVLRGRGKVFNYFLFVGKRVRGLPYIEEEEILEAKSFREIEKIARERNEER